jgi:hypothetical protein
MLKKFLPTPRSTIKNDPFAAVIPEPAENVARDLEPREPSVPRHFARRVPQLARHKLTVHLRPDIIERVKNAAYWNPRLTISSIAESGIIHALEEVEREHGGPYPQRDQELRGGRPMK